MNNIIKNTLSTNSFWMVNKTLAKYFGDNDCALYLADLISKYQYFESIDQLDNGFFFNTQDNIYNDTNIPHKRQLQYIKKLQELKIIETRKAGLPAKTYYRINFEVIESILVKQESSKRLDCSSQNDQTVVAKMTKLESSKRLVNNNKYNNNKEIIINEDNYTDEQNKSTHHPRYSKISDLDSNELKHELLERFDKRDQLQVISDLEDMKLWLESNGKRKKDYKAFAINWIKKNEAKERLNAKKISYSRYPIAGEVMGSI